MGIHRALEEAVRQDHKYRPRPFPGGRALAKPIPAGCTTAQNSKATTNCYKKNIEPHATGWVFLFFFLSIKSSQSLFGLMSPVRRVGVICVEILT